MTRDIKTALADSVEQAKWEWLEPHLKRDALILVSPNLDLVEVGVAIAQDETSLVKQWIETGQLQKPSSNQLSLWHSQPSKSFKALIVQPYVLVQEPPLDANAELD